MKKSVLLLASVASAILLASAFGLVAPAKQAKAVLSADAGRIAFQSDRNRTPDNPEDIYVMNPDGSGTTRLNRPGFEGSPAISPDGKRIAFNSDGDIYIMDVDGTHQVNLTDTLGAGENYPKWSPDGSEILFESRDPSSYATTVHTINVDGTGRTKLFDGTADNPTGSPQFDYAGNPTWSPDGSKIAFVKRTLIDNQPWYNIFIGNADGTGVPVNLTNSTEAHAALPSWSPDGGMIAYTANESGPIGHWSLNTINVDGSGRNKLLTQGEPAPASWSPDGSKIAFARFELTPIDGGGIEWDIHTINADGTGEAKIAHSGQDYAPDWWGPPVYDFGGFFSPVDNPGVLNKVKAGSAIPVKFSLGGDMGLDIFAEAPDGSGYYPKSGAMACDSTDPVDAIEQTASAGSSGLTYDAATDRYTYVWKTNKAWTGCRQLVVKLDDGNVYRANFKLVN